MSSNAMRQSPESRAIDLVHLSRQTFGDRDLEREVLALFRDQCTRLLATIARMGRDDAGSRATHTLKGAALGVGAFAVADAAERIEAGVIGWNEGLADLIGAVDVARQTIDRLLTGEAD